METDLRRQIGELVDRGAEPLSFYEIRARRKRAPRPWRGAMVASGVAIGVSGVAAALTLSFTGSPGVSSGRVHAVGEKHATGAVLTAAMVRELASASRSALAYSGYAAITYRSSGTAVQPDYGTEDVTFSGANWNDVFSESIVHPSSGATNTWYSISRVVDGQAYQYIPTTSREPHWVHPTNPGAVQAMNIPDPRTLLQALQPGAGFSVVGYQLVDGVRLEHVRATRLNGLDGFAASLRWALPDEHIRALDIWADSAGVVRRMDISLSGTVRCYPVALTHAQVQAMADNHLTIADIARNEGIEPVYESESTSLTLAFSGIGQRQTIVAPAGAVDIYERG
jgi:hypothetical protein